MANPAPPVCTALGHQGIKIMDFCNEFNEKTKDMKGSLIPSIITIFEDRSFSFVIKKPPVSDMIKKVTGISKGSGTTGREKIGKITNAQITKVAGTAKSMGFEIVD